MIMRWIFAFFLIFVGIYLLKGSTSRLIAIRRILFTIFVLAGITSLVFQNYWTSLSKFLGVESGTALLTYLVTFSFISYVISTYKWRREFEHKLTLLAREKALQNFANENDRE